MRKFFVLSATLLLVLLATSRLRALTDEEKKEAFLNARAAGESDSSPSPHRKKHPSPSPSPHHHHSPTPEPDETPSHHHSTPEPDETPAHHHPTPEPDETPSHHHPSPEAEETPRHKEHSHPAHDEPPPKHTPTPPLITWPEDAHPSPSRTPAAPSYTPPPPAAALPQATPAPTPPGASYGYGAQVDIQKEGLEQQGGYEPPPLQPPSHHHWWQFFGSSSEPVQYHYLTRAIRDALDRAPVAKRRWRYIVVHNSGTRQGNAKIFDYYHRYVRKMPNGLAYHFVIGNGTSSGNGQIEIGNRWTRQINGGHVHSDFLNNISLGICLVGDFNRDLPTKEQLEALDELIRYLRIRVGKIDRQWAIVKAHKEINPVPTDCPGDRFPYHWLHSRFD